MDYQKPEKYTNNSISSEISESAFTKKACVSLKHRLFLMPLYVISHTETFLLEQAIYSTNIFLKYRCAPSEIVITYIPFP